MRFHRIIVACAPTWIIVTQILAFLTAAANATPAQLAKDFVAGLGVNTHMCYTDGAYVNFEKVIAHLEYLRLKRIRDGIPDMSNSECRRAAWVLEGMAKRGIRMNLIRTPRPLAEQLSVLKTLQAADPQTVESLEGFNEINNWPVTVDGVDGLRGAALGQRQLFRATRTSSYLRGVKVLDLTGEPWPRDPSFPYGGNLTGYADWDNLHAYPQNGSQPHDWLGLDAATGRISGRPAPRAMTEFGYASMPQAGWYVIGVDERSQAKGIVNSIFQLARAGFTRSYVYELLDEKPDPLSTSIQWHFGLFTFEGEPKLAARAIRRIVGLLGDPGASADTPPPSVAMTISAPDAEPVYTHLLAKSDGSLVLALWREPPFWRRDVGQPIDNPVVRVSVTMPGAWSAVSLYDPLSSHRPRRLPMAPTVRVPVSDYVRLVEFRP